MSNVAIDARNLGKEYFIGGAQKQYDALSEQIRDVVLSPFRRAGKLLTGKAQSAAELEEAIWALKDASFKVNPGEAVGVIGRNGAGKSTLLKVLSRITVPTTGEAFINGRVGSLLEVGTGFHPELTGRENVFLNGAILGMRRQEIRQKFDEIVDFAEIEQFIDTPVKHYSSGMYVRLAFSVAAHLEPEVLLIDEVLAVGDLAFQKKCLGKMDDVAQRGRTILFVSHNMALIQSLCERGIFLQGGEIAYDGPVGDAVNAYLETLEELENIDLADRTDRRGAGKVRLMDLDIVNSAGESTTVLTTGEQARFDFTLNQLVSDVICQFVFYNHLGQRVAVFKSDLFGDVDAYDPNLGNTFSCEFDRVLLMPGRYHVNVFIRGDGERQDWIEAAAMFDVQDGHIDGRPINFNKNVSVHLPHRWSVPVKV